MLANLAPALAMASGVLCLCASARTRTAFFRLRPPVPVGQLIESARWCCLWGPAVTGQLGREEPPLARPDFLRPAPIARTGQNLCE